MSGRARTRLRCDEPIIAGFDTGGDGPPVLILHGLAGTSHEWEETAAWLSPDFRVIVPDQRGHGCSARVPGRYRLGDYARDAIDVLEHMSIGPAALIGHSLGGQVAMLVAAERTTSALVVVEAGISPSRGAADAVKRWLADWPVPFADLDSAIDFFDSIGLNRAWADGLVLKEDGYHPAFAIEDMIESALGQETADLANVWRRSSCPTLVVRADAGFLEQDEAQRMIQARPPAELAEVVGSGHDVHLDQPAAWRDIVEPFLGEKLLSH
jgi:pimeloyl-ACP methyl ester carboxylesterase